MNLIHVWNDQLPCPIVHPLVRPIHLPGGPQAPNHDDRLSCPLVHPIDLPAGQLALNHDDRVPQHPYNLHKGNSAHNW